METEDWHISQSDYFATSGDARAIARSVRLQAAATIYTRGGALGATYEACARAVRELELALWLEDKQPSPDSYLAEDALEDIANAARALTMLDTTDTGAIVVGPQGWSMLMECLANQYPDLWTTSRPLSLGIGLLTVQFANDRPAGLVAASAWKYKVSGSSSPWAEARGPYESFRMAYDAAVNSLGAHG